MGFKRTNGRQSIKVIIPSQTVVRIIVPIHNTSSGIGNRPFVGWLGSGSQRQKIFCSYIKTRAPLVSLACESDEQEADIQLTKHNKPTEG